MAEGDDNEQRVFISEQMKDERLKRSQVWDHGVNKGGCIPDVGGPSASSDAHIGM